MPQSPSTKPSIPRFNQLKWKMAGAGILVGLTSGLLVVLYRLGIERGTDAARWIYSQIRVTRAVGAVVRCGCRSGPRLLRG